MFCYQCQEAAKGVGCTKSGVCGKTEDVANLQDLLIYILKGISVLSKDKADEKVDQLVIDSLFATITNANFSKSDFLNRIKKAINLRESLKSKGDSPAIDAVTWTASSDAELEKKAAQVGILTTENEDVRSLRELLIYGAKGVAAYAHHAEILGQVNPEITMFIKKALASTLDDTLSADNLVALVLECGKFGVDALALLDKANTDAYGHPEVTSVNIGVRNNPGILVSGHDLKDLEELLIQTKGTGVDIYTHSEMLPAHYYPAFKKYDHFVGNYGNAWWKQQEEFDSFNGPILMTTNCIVTPKESYKDRIYTTGIAGFEGVQHIPDRQDGRSKDFNKLIIQAKKCRSPKQIEEGEIVGGFAHNAVAGLAGLVVDSVKTGRIKKFIVMAGCDGRHKERDYYTEFAKALPQDTVILTAGCAKYRYNKLDLGFVNGVHRVIDAGQCNDSYSLVVTALKLKEIFELDDINDLPIEYNIAWYEQKAVIVLLALLYLGVKNIHLGPTLPAFLSPNVVNVLVEKFGIGGISSVEADVKAMS